jgi:hypothetical protein
MMQRRVRICVASVAAGVLTCAAAVGAGPAVAALENDELSVLLSVDQSGWPCLAQAAWKTNSELIFRNTLQPLGDWFPSQLVPVQRKPVQWSCGPDECGMRGEANLELSKGVRATWVVDLPSAGSTLRLQVCLTNSGTEPRAVPWYPIWNAAWSMPGCAEKVRWWKSLTFEPVEQTISAASRLQLHSRVHSSDELEAGVNPYWRVSGPKGTVYFALEWCGGWSAELNANEDGLGFRAVLPEDETRLVLEPGGSVAGPILNVALIQGRTEVETRREWMRQRLRLARCLYTGPAPSFPFGWNHWYTVRFNVDRDFLQRQADSVAPYGFDYFVVDAGWYEACGKWTPDPRKFAPGEFERILASIRAKGPKIGLWTCPQFVAASKDALPPEVDQPAFYRRFINGYLLDMASMDFTHFLLEHVGKLRRDYQMEWWKYDQDFFVPTPTRAGRMKDVLALQQALRAVRKANPDLYIENCQSGGRMINEQTVLMAQAQWIRDGSRTGLTHARSNWGEALGALEFLPPWTILRWTNRPDENDPADDEFTRMYCRSAMAGIWGVVADLPKISERQRRIIVREAAEYRRCNELKQDCLYELYRPAKGAPAAGITYYDDKGTRAATLLLRWDTTGPFTFPVKLSHLRPGDEYRIEACEGDPPAHVQEGNIIPIRFSATQQSCLVFVSLAPNPRSAQDRRAE